MSSNSCEMLDPSLHHRQKAVVSDLTFQTGMSSLMDFGTPDSSLDKASFFFDLSTHGGCEAQKRMVSLALEMITMKGDRKRLKAEKADLVNQMQQLYTTLESREEQLRDFIRNYDQHRKESEDAVKALAKEKDMLEREKWDLRRQTKEATEQASTLRSQIDMKENRIKELEAELTMAKQSLATLTKDVPKRHSLAMPSEPVVNGSQEWVMQADLPLTAAIRQSQQTLYHSHPADRQDSDSLASQNHPSLSDGEEQLERLQQAELTRSKPMSLWKAVTVQAWLEVVMAMPMYMRACSENVKSGKVLLGLTDEDLELGLGINSPMHRRKLRLAIEDYREAENGRGLSKAADMDHHWVSKTWLSDVGLPQYSQVFHNQLVDGRVLNSITRRDLETVFNITNKFHTIQARRAQCENRDLDPVVWTSHRVIKWIRDIDLKEYADSLQNSGIHGAVMVLDPTFSADTMAKALDIPSNKHMIHRHLYEEMKVLLNPARTNQAQDYRKDGTPTHSPSSNCRKTEEGFSPRQKVGKSPLRFNPLVAVGRDLTFQGGCGSPPREERIKILQRTKGSPMHGYSSIEITNV
ncbi:kazrin-like protein [Labeo rohita]|uniref:Kazrin-like protein n=1 Tax=Labeo rohita TaxID=84645 RepID=A0A498NJ18_LABRO|nr:kazrin-like protein [Labeo rohita]RXN31796.1 kazrin-like protein [Labeo rohita]